MRGGRAGPLAGAFLAPPEPSPTIMRRLSRHPETSPASILIPIPQISSSISKLRFSHNRHLTPHINLPRHRRRNQRCAILL